MPFIQPLALEFSDYVLCKRPEFKWLGHYCPMTLNGHFAFSVCHCSMTSHMIVEVKKCQYCGHRNLFRQSQQIYIVWNPATFEGYLLMWRVFSVSRDIWWIGMFKRMYGTTSSVKSAALLISLRHLLLLLNHISTLPLFRKPWQRSSLKNMNANHCSG